MERFLVFVSFLQRKASLKAMVRPKSERVQKVESMFQNEGGGVYLCLADGCRVRVRCAEGCGARGRTAHVERCHAESLDGLVKQKRKPPPSKRAREGEGEAKDEEETQDDEEPKTQPKRPEHDEDEVVDFFCRNPSLPFSLVDDKFFRKSGLSRFSLPHKIAKRSEELMSQFVTQVKGQKASICIDSGTNCGIRTLNVTMLVQKMLFLSMSPSLPSTQRKGSSKPSRPRCHVLIQEISRPSSQTTRAI